MSHNRLPRGTVDCGGQPLDTTPTAQISQSP